MSQVLYGKKECSAYFVYVDWQLTLVTHVEEITFQFEKNFS